MFAEIVLINYARPLKARAAARKMVGPYRWRPAGPHRGAHPGVGFYSATGDMLKMDSHGSSLRLRLEDANAHISGRLSHTSGYFCDADGHGDTLKPIIARLPRGRGFLAGWTMGEGMCATLDGHIYADEHDAALAAHGEAESAAEAQRERDADDDDGEFR